MLLAIIGESCVGKSSLAQRLCQEMNAEVYTGKDYLRLQKSEDLAKRAFVEKLKAAVSGETLIYVITEKEHLSLLPEGAVRILMTADLPLILERFASRMHGKLPAPVQQMLERKHGCFDRTECHYHIHNNQGLDDLVETILCKK